MRIVWEYIIVNNMMMRNKFVTFCQSMLKLKIVVITEDV